MIKKCLIVVLSAVLAMVNVQTVAGHQLAGAFPAAGARAKASMRKVLRLKGLTRRFDRQLREPAAAQVSAVRKGAVENLLHVEITRRDEEGLRRKVDRLVDSAFRDYRFDPEIEERVGRHIHDFYHSHEWRELLTYHQNHLPHRDEETTIVFEEFSEQWQRVLDAARMMDRQHTDNGDQYRSHGEDVYWVVIKNQDWDRFDAAYRKLLRFRKALIDTKWGQEMKARVDDVKASQEFKNLEADWRQQCQYEAHIQAVYNWEDLLEDAFWDIQITEYSNDFYKGHFVRQAMKFVDFIDESIHGDLQGIYDYLLDEDNYAE